MTFGQKDNRPNSQHFIFFVTYKWAKQVRVLHYPKQEMLARAIHSSLLGPFTSYNYNTSIAFKQ